MQPVDTSHSNFVDYYDELPLWSAPFARLLLDRVPIQAGMTILDVGAGTGFLTIELAQRCGESSRVIAVDPWATAMNRLRHKVDHLRLTNVRLIEQDAATVDLPDESVDLVVSNLGINNFENAADVLWNCYRMTKAGGRQLLTTNLVGHMREFYDVYRSVLTEAGRDDGVAALETHINHRATVASSTKQLKQAGYQQIEAVTDSFQLRFANGTALLNHYFIRLGFLPVWKAIVPAEAVIEVFTALEQKLNDLAAASGELSLTIPIACLTAQRE